MSLQNTPEMGNHSGDLRPDFYSSILPMEGVRVLAVFKGGLKAPPTHQYFDTNDKLLAAASKYDAEGINAYHACATYKERINRKGENVLAAKCLWVDLDVGENKPYASKKEAVAAYERFRATAGLSPCHVVDSGNGIHIYQPLTEPITPDQWDRLADLFRSCLDHYGVKHDSSRTTDKASILRIPGTSNQKANPPKPVVIKRMGVEAPAGEIWAKLKAYADSNGVVVASKLKKGKVTETNDVIGNRLNFPPSKAENIIAHCAVLRAVAESGGDCAYDTWWKAMGVAKHTTQPEAVAVFWTRNREATGHDKFDAIKAINEWGAGPTTCARFAENVEAAARCTTCLQTKGAV